MSVCIVRRRRQRRGQPRLRLSQKGLRIVSHVADADQHVDIAGMQLERALEETARLRHHLRSEAAIEQRPPLTIELRQIGYMPFLSSSSIHSYDIHVVSHY